MLLILLLLFCFTNSYLLDICKPCNFSYYFKYSCYSKVSRSYPRKTLPAPKRQSALHGNKHLSVHTIGRCAMRERFLLLPIQLVENPHSSTSICSHCSLRASCFTGASPFHWRVAAEVLLHCASQCGCVNVACLFPRDGGAVEISFLGASQLDVSPALP